MATGYTTLLGLALPVTGELSGTWGDTVNDYLTKFIDSAVAGTQTISGSQTAVTLSKTEGSTLSSAGSGSTGSSQYAVINCTGNPAGTLTITAPAASKTYVLINATSTNQSVKIVGAGPTTGVTAAAGEKCLVSWNGSDFVKVGGGINGPASSTSGNIATFNGTTGNTIQDGGKALPSGSVVGTTDSQTLTNKTLTSPRIGTSILDTNGNELFLLTATASAVNELTVANAATGNSPTISASGGDTNISISLTPKGAGNTLITSGSLGLGVTPSAWSSDHKAIQIGAGSAFWGQSSQSATFVSANTRFDGTNFRYLNTAAATYYATFSGAHQWFTAPSGTAGDAISFTQAMTLNASGNLGVGTSSPGGKLDVAGSIANVQIASTGVDVIFTRNDANYITASDAAGFLIFRTGGNNERLRIDSSGNLGLGVVPSAWDGKAIQVRNTSALYEPANRYTHLASNVYESGGSFRYLTTGHATLYSANRDAGVHTWYTAPSGTAGDAISFTEAMSLSASSNLSIAGTVTAVGSLNVAGTSATGADIKLYEDTDNGTNYVSFKAPSTLSANLTWTLPTADGGNGQVLSTNGSGTLSWVDVSSGMTYPAAGIAVSTGSAWTTSLTAPAGDLVGTTATQTLTNKTLTSPKVGTAILDQNGNELLILTATVSATNELTLANAVNGSSPSITASGSSDANVSINLIPKGSGTVQVNSVPVVTTTGTQTLTNKTLTSPTISTITNTGTLTLPTSTDTLVGRATTDTLTNKTLTAPVISTITNTGTLTLPTSTDTLVGRATTDTLTNKTLTSPRIGTSILDTNGNELALLTATASAVNEITLANAATGGKPTISATGNDTNITLNLVSKGTGTVQANGADLVTATSTTTLTNKTIEAATFTNGYTEETATANTGTAYTIDLAGGSLQILTLTGNCTFTFPTATAGRSFMLLLKQDGTGSRTATWPSAVKWPGGSTPTVTATANKGDKFIFTADGTNWYGSVGGQNYTTT